MAELQRPAIFKWRHFSPEIILCAVRWYLRYSLSYREVQELLVERGDRSYDGLAMGSALRTGTRGANPAASEADQQILAGR